MKAYAEQTWGYWDGRANFDSALDEVITHEGQDVGMLRVDRLPDHWFLSKLYILPAFQGRHLGSKLLQQIIADAKAASLPLRLTVLEVNPARRFYELHGFVVTQTIPPRHHMEISLYS